MKKIVFASLLLITVLLVTGCGEQNGAAPIAVNKPVTATQQSSGKTISAADVAIHNSSTDCYEIIRGKVYDVTIFVPKHPGGVDKISKYCGADATKAFDSNPKHAGAAQTILAGLYIGDLK